MPEHDSKGMSSTGEVREGMNRVFRPATAPGRNRCFCSGSESKGYHFAGEHGPLASKSDQHSSKRLIPRR